MPTAIVFVAPKCVLCLAAYLGLGSTLGWTGAELCGAPANDAAAPIAWLAVAGLVSALGVLLVRGAAGFRKR